MQNSGGWDGTLSPNDFHLAANFLSNRWKQICRTLPQWNWIPCSRVPVGASCNAQPEGYLSLENIYYLNFDKVCYSVQEHADELGVSEEEDIFDTATLNQGYNDEAHIYNFNIVYSFSYRVPVLYFRGFRCDGQLLNLDDIQKDLPCYSSSILRESKWTFITQEDHPYLGRPWHTLHPCGTGEWMRLLHCEDNFDVVRYLPSWLSVVGQAVGLRIPLELQDMPPHDTSLSSATKI